MKYLKKTLAVLLVLVMVFAAVACGGTTTDNNNTANNSTDNGGAADTGNSGSNDANSGGATGGNTSKKDTLSFTCTVDSGTLDPMQILGYDTGFAMRMVYETLWDIDSKGNMVMILATDLTFVEPTIWHIKLREGVFFSNGNPFTAEDALFSIFRGNTMPGAPPFLPELNLEESKVLDEYTIELIFNNYDLSLTAGMASVSMFYVESFDEETVPTTPMGTGPYIMTTYVINSHIYLEARESGYWGDAPAIKNIHCKVLAEDFQRVNALETGTSDISSIPFQDIEYVESLDGITVALSDSTYGTCIYFNLTDNTVFFENPDARKAIALAIDNQAVADIAYSGYAKISRLPVSMAHIDWTDDILDLGVYGIGYDPDLARQYAESSGLVGQKLKAICSASAADIAVGELMQSDLQAIGVELEVVTLDAGSIITIAGDPTEFDIFISLTSAPSMTIAQNYSAYIQYMVGGTFLTSPWPGRDRFVELVTGIMAISDPAELQSRYKEMTEIHVDALPWYGIVDQQNANAYNSDLIGYERMLMGNVNFHKLSWAS